MAKELDNKKMWELLIEGNSVTYESGRVERGDLALRIIRALRDQGFDYQDGDIVPIEPEFKANSGQNENQIGVQIGGQKPKFKVGDWIVFNGLSLYINEVVQGYYRTISKGGIPNSYDWNIDNAARLWTIQDAKDGDVVVDKSDGTIGIFQNIGHHPDGGSYNDPFYCFLHCRYDDGYFYADFENGNTMYLNDVIPATKEQRDTLMKAMADEGYTFDFDKKELKKIEQKPADKVELKFKVDDWVVYNRNDHSREILQVYDIRDGRYYFNDNVHLSWSIKECDEKSHLWTIQDAKDGDVLNSMRVQATIIFKGFADDGKHILAYSALQKGIFIKEEMLWDRDFEPCPKNWNDELFSKMHEAGYEWDADKKELKKIEQKPVGAKEVLEEIEKALDLGEPPYLISVEQAYYRVNKLVKELKGE